MKIQDILFVVLLLWVLWKQKSFYSTILGLVCLLVSIPLFASWVFFSAQRLVWYGAAFFAVAIILELLKLRKGKSEDRN